LDTLADDGRGAPLHVGQADIEDEHGGLEDIEADDLLHQVAATDHGVEPGHHEEDGHPVVVLAEMVREPIHQSRPLPAKAKKMITITAVTVRPTPSSTRMMPRCWPATGSAASRL